VVRLRGDSLDGTRTAVRRDVKALEWLKKFPQFLKDVSLEVKKTSFPSRAEVTNTTTVVVVVVAIFGVYLWIVDQVIFSLLNQLFERFK
jgi:preprotein translocase subunit SecE